MVNISHEAKEYILNISQKNNAIGISVGVVKGGCSGMQFKFSIEKEKNDQYEEIKVNQNTSFFIKNSALVFVVGSTLTYQKTMTGGRLVFENSNIKRNCSCGKSFR